MDPIQAPPVADPDQAQPQAAPTPAATAAPDQSQMVPMLGPKGETVQVASDRVPAAQAAGYKSAYKMTGPDGSPAYVAEDRVGAARQANYAVAQDNPNVQKMVTPDGRLTYALPGEVSQFEASGHTKIAPDGRFEVKPLPGEDNTDTMKRAVNVGRALGPEQMQKSAQAEQNWWTSKEGLTDEAKGLFNVTAAGAETLSALAGGSEVGAAGKVGLKALGETETMQLIKSSPRLYAEWVLKHPETQKLAIKTAAKVGGGAASAIGAGGIYAAYKWLTKLQ